MTGEADALDRLTAARDELARYRKVCRGLTAGASVGTTAFLGAMLLLPAAFGIGLTIVSSIITAVCTVILICRIATAHSTTTQYVLDTRGGAERHMSRHPADKVRAAERAYERAVMEAK